MEGKNPANSSPPTAQVKKENEEEIKEFAETAMNELLGWYGYERLELRRWAASRANDAASPDRATDQKGQEECSWCSKAVGAAGGPLQHAGAVFCSELCFSQSRRANFKRAKTCDWCRHVRHTVAYVDFQDGATQLQFCSDKCLNQYKMHIFCRETQAHLELHPHLAAPPSAPPSSLITPDLWLNTRTPSPHSDASKSPDQKPKSPVPVITVAPTAKLMKKREERKSPEGKETKSKMSLRKRRTSKTATVTSSQARQATLDLRKSPSLDSSPPSTNSTVLSPPLQPPPFQSPMFVTPNYMDFPPPAEPRHRMFPPRLSFMRPNAPLHQERPRLPPPLNFPLLNQSPPVTVMVPYPVVLPVPIPIPIPIPLTSFLRAHMSKVKPETKADDSEGPLDFTMNSDRRKRSESISDSNPNTNVVEERIVFHELVNSPSERLEQNEKRETVEENGNAEQTLPKFKITRLGSKSAKIVPKSRDISESTRPLRKRRRLVDVSSEDDTLVPKSRKIVEV